MSQEKDAAPAPVQRLVGLRIGDSVKHIPTGEEWIVAKVMGDFIYCAGWPCTLASFDDLELIERCSDSEHLAMVGRLMNISPSDPRHMVRNMLIDCLMHLV